MLNALLDVVGADERHPLAGLLDDGLSAQFGAKFGLRQPVGFHEQAQHGSRLGVGQDVLGDLIAGYEARELAAELTWALILALLRRLPQESAAFRADGPWQSTLGNDLAGKRLGVIGLGKLGTRVAAVAKAFGMNVTAWSRNLTAERCAEAGVAFAGSLEALLESADIVTLHVVLSARTQGLLGERELRRMKPTALLINTSRGPLVDERALIAALSAGTIAGAGLDVFDVEPLPAGHPFRRLPNVVATPHLGYVTTENYRTLYAGAVEDIAAWLDGDPIRVIPRPT